MPNVPNIRISSLNDQPLMPNRAYVLYWMTANRRANWNYSLDRALELCGQLGKPLLVLEALRCDYPWASDRLHRFILQGMADNRKSFEGTPVRHYAYVEPSKGASAGLLRALAADAAAIVTDDFPCFFLQIVILTQPACKASFLYCPFFATFIFFEV